MNRVLVIVAIATLPFSAPTPSSAPTLAGPRLIMFYGGALEGRRAYLTDIWEVIGFMRSYGESEPQNARDTLGRAYVNIGLYWNNVLWEPYALDTLRLKTLPAPDPAVPFSP